MSDTGFWSRRRAAVEAEERAEEADRVSAEKAAEEEQLAARSDAELLNELNLRDPDVMDSATEIRELLKAALPQRLKTRALRRLWRLNPVLANVDGLVDYGEDFTDSATVVENMQTAYQVGKGMLKSIEAYAKEAEEKAAALARVEAGDAAEIETAPDPAPGSTPDSVAEQAPEPPEAMVARTPDGTSAPEPDPAQDMAVLTPGSRRMRFTFDEAAT